MVRTRYITTLEANILHTIGGEGLYLTVISYGEPGGGQQYVIRDERSNLRPSGPFVVNSFGVIEMPSLGQHHPVRLHLPFKRAM